MLNPALPHPSWLPCLWSCNAACWPDKYLITVQSRAGLSWGGWEHQVKAVWAVLGYRQRPNLRWPLAAQEAGLPMVSDGHPSNQTTISSCFPPKAAGRSELRISVVSEVAQRCQGAEDVLQAGFLWPHLLRLMWLGKKEQGTRTPSAVMKNGF